MVCFGTSVLLLLWLGLGFEKAHGQNNVTTQPSSQSNPPGQSPVPGGTNEKDDVCESMRIDTDTYPIILAGVLRNQLIVIGRNYNVYELPVTALNRGVDKLHLSSKPTPLATKYPALWRYEDFQSIQQSLHSAFTAMDETAGYLCFVSAQGPGVNYDLAKGTVHPGWSKRDTKFDLRIISTNATLRSYALRWQSGLPFFYSVRYMGNKITSKPSMYPKDKLLLCFDDQDRSSIYASDDDACLGEKTQVDWPKLRGLVYRKTFYLFSAEHVYVFSEMVAMKPNTRRTWKRIPLKNFFLCHNEPAPPPFNGTDEPDPDPVRLGIFAILIIVSLIFFLLVCLICCLAMRIGGGGGGGGGSGSGHRHPHSSSTHSSMASSSSGSSSTLSGTSSRGSSIHSSSRGPSTLSGSSRGSSRPSSSHSSRGSSTTLSGSSRGSSRPSSSHSSRGSSTHSSSRGSSTALSGSSRGSSKPASGSSSKGSSRSSSFSKGSSRPLSGSSRGSSRPSSGSFSKGSSRPLSGSSRGSSKPYSGSSSKSSRPSTHYSSSSKKK